MSSELSELTAHMDASGLPYRLTSGQRPPRYSGDTSLHVVGRAADFAGPTPWNQDRRHQPLYDIWEYWMAAAGSLRELIYSGAPYYVSRGQVHPISDLPPSLKSSHWNHVHVGVDPGWQSSEVVMPPTLPANEHVISGHAIAITAVANSAGEVTGYLVLGSDGGVFAFGPGARYHGRVHNGDGTA